MMLRRLITVIAVIGALAIYVVYEQSRIIRAGYKVSELSRDEAKLVEQVRLVKIQVTKLRQPEFIEQQVRFLQIDLMRLPKSQVQTVAAAGSRFTQ